MSLDSGANGLLEKVQALASKTFDTIFTADKTIPDLVRGILYRWAGVEGVAAGSRGPNVDAKELAFLEKLMGQGFTQRNYYANPGPLAGKGLAEAFDLAYDAFYARLLAQGAGKALFAGDVRYNLATDVLEGITGLSTASLDALKAEAKGLGTGAARAALWENAVRLVEFGYGVAALGAAHRTALDNAIKSSDATLSLAKVLAVLHPENGDKVLSGGIGDDIITTGTGNDVIDAHAGNDVIRTGAGNDRIFGGIDVWNELGGGGNDTMTGGTGDDFIDGYDGNDLYLYALGDGRDTYTDASGADRIVLGTGITAANLAFNRAGDADLVITIANATQPGEIIIQDQFKSAGGIEKIQFSDGSTLDLTTRNYTYSGTGGNDTLYGVSVGGGKTDILYGKDGDDTLWGYVGDDRLYGDNGNDKAYGGEGNDSVYGGTGNDALYGDNGNDKLYGDAGDDTVFGGAGNDLYYYASGRDAYTDNIGVDAVHMLTAYAPGSAKYYKFGVDLQIFFSPEDNFTIKSFFTPGGTTLKTLNFTDGTVVDLTKVVYLVQGDDASNTLYGSSSTDWLWGMAGDDVLKADDGNDILYGGAGNDTLYGGKGDDLYHYVSGKDIFAESLTGNDTIQIDGGWKLSDMAFNRYAASLKDLVITLTPANSLTLVGQLYDPYGLAQNSVETLKFGDGSTLNLLTQKVVSYGSEAADDINGVQYASPDDTIYGYGGNDAIYGGYGNDKIYGGDGNDALNGGEGSDYLEGGAGDDIIDGREGNDILYGGAGNDTLYGGRDDDLYYYVSGNDIFVENETGNDIIKVDGGWKLSDMAFNRYAANPYDLVITLTPTNSLTLAGQYYDPYGQARYAVETLKFGDGSTLNLLTQKVVTYGSEGNDSIAGILFGASPDDTMYGYGGNDALYGDNGNDKLYGGDGNDTLKGGEGNDYLEGGAGDDIIDGGVGSDTYYYTAGKDVYSDYNSIADVVQLSSAWTSSSVQYKRYIADKDNLVLELNATNSITLQSQFYNAYNSFETLKFSNGSTVNLTTAKFTTYGSESADYITGILYGASPDDTIYGYGGNDTLYGYGGNDKLYGGDGNDTLNGAEGNDYLEGGAGDDIIDGGVGSDTYYYTAGKDVYSDYSSIADVVQLSSAWTSSSVQYKRYIADKDSLVLEFNATNSITLKYHFYGADYAFETLKFSNGGTVNLTTLKMSTYGTEGADYMVGVERNASPDDTMYGYGGDDKIYGANGNDRIYGGNGNDSLWGDAGNDLLYGQAGIDTLYGGAGSDSFIFEKATAYTGIDVIKDFKAAEGDTINIADLFSTHPTAGNINSYVSLTSNGAHMSLLVDKDGAASGSSFQQIATLEYTSGLTVNDLLTKGNLVV